MVDMYANLGSNITCSNAFKDLVNSLFEIAFPANSPLSSMLTIALDGINGCSTENSVPHHLHNHVQQSLAKLNLQNDNRLKIDQT